MQKHKTVLLIGLVFVALISVFSMGVPTAEAMMQPNTMETRQAKIDATATATKSATKSVTVTPVPPTKTPTKAATKKATTATSRCLLSPPAPWYNYEFAWVLNDFGCWVLQKVRGVNASTPTSTSTSTLRSADPNATPTVTPTRWPTATPTLHPTAIPAPTATPESSWLDRLLGR